MQTNNTKTNSQPQQPPLDGPALLNDVSHFISRYLLCSREQSHLLALWALHTWCFSAASLTPYLAILSPQPQAGKTLCLQILSLLGQNASLTSTLSVPALFGRMRFGPSSAILLDDAQAVVGTASRPKNPSLRSLLGNGSHLGHGCLSSIKDRQLFCPKAFALTGQLPDDLAQHCLPIVLQPLPQQEGRWFTINGIKRFDFRRATQDAESLRQRLSAWAQQHLQEIEQRPVYGEEEFPHSSAPLNPRRMALMEPLLQIADVVGGPWPRHIRQALDAIFAEGDQFQLYAHRQLLQDLHFCFSLQGFLQRLSTAFILDFLHSLQNRPWQAEGPINAHRLARMLGAFEIMPRVQRMGSEQTARGYQLLDFQDAWHRHLGIEMRRDPDGRFHPAVKSHSDVTPEPPKAKGEKSEILNKDAGCNGVELAAAMALCGSPNELTGPHALPSQP
jgi:hypothetical protein